MYEYNEDGILEILCKDEMTDMSGYANLIMFLFASYCLCTTKRTSTSSTSVNVEDQDIPTYPLGHTPSKPQAYLLISQISLCLLNDIVPKEPVAKPGFSPIVVSTPKRACAFMPAAVPAVGGAVEHVEQLSVFRAQLAHLRRPGLSQPLVQEQAVGHIALVSQIRKHGAEDCAIFDGLGGSLCAILLQSAACWDSFFLVDSGDSYR